MSTSPPATPLDTAFVDGLTRIFGSLFDALGFPLRWSAGDNDNTRYASCEVPCGEGAFTLQVALVGDRGHFILRGLTGHEVTDAELELLDEPHHSLEGPLFTLTCKPGIGVTLATVVALGTTDDFPERLMAAVQQLVARTTRLCQKLETACP